MSFSPAEIRFLSAHRDDIARVAASGEVALTKKSAIADRTVLSKLFDDQARAVMELLQARQTLAPKLAGPAADWMADSDSAQQATPFAVSQVRAGRIAAAGASLVHDVTCSIGTEAPAVTAAGMDWLGTDFPP
ncbi:hypothetical protein [Corynebacterium sp. Marseille-P3884]|uniref:hypothetical protein n=1 Tax=Corynebacterium sp. Marseille-P3884 TaxID=2495409 RepID=UPI001B33E45B|nr:hypothetical protein [Corynebacterium sp. Marseille-P3884]MBP3949031.1 hypothetical protein [Corynebacterium sp. Marseille-P3884]